MADRITARCCVVGGGPAGMMLGLLLARAGVEVVVLEKHADFFRDFRGDTIHPSTLDVIGDLGLLDEFLEIPHTELPRIGFTVGDRTFELADFSRLPTRCRFIAMMPQWDFLDFLARHARTYAGFRLEMETEATDLIERNGRFVGVRAETPSGEVEIAADLVVAADGRDSVMPTRARLGARDYGVPFDVLWFRLPKRGDAPPSLGRIGEGPLLVTIDRGDYWQCGMVIPKGGADEVRDGGIPAFRRRIARIAPNLGPAVEALAGWDDVKLLTVQVRRLERWHRPGLLCIGDAAHAMSPAGGVGINLAVQDAVAAANLLAAPLARSTLDEDDLRQVQKRRELPARALQALQTRQGAAVARIRSASDPRVRVLVGIARIAPARHFLGRLIGLGFRRERVRTPAVVSR